MNGMRWLLRVMFVSLRIPLLMLCVAYVVPGMAAEQAVTQPVTQAVRGTIQELRQDEGYITISGRRVPFLHGESQVFLNGVLVKASLLDEGMVVRYSTNAAGTITMIEILGPLDKLRAITEN